MNVVLYCASSPRIAPAFFEAARRLATLMARAGVNVVCGGGRAGLMGAVIDAQLEVGAAPIGVLPSFMVERGWQHPGLARPIVTEGMHPRKERMLQLADGGAVALAGGIGTFEELLEAMTWRQLGLYKHPVVILNTDGYYDPLLEQLHRAEQGHFMRKAPSTLYYVADTPEQVLTYLDIAYAGE